MIIDISGKRIRFCVRDGWSRRLVELCITSGKVFECRLSDEKFNYYYLGLNTVINYERLLPLWSGFRPEIETEDVGNTIDEYTKY